MSIEVVRISIQAAGGRLLYAGNRIVVGIVLPLYCMHKNAETLRRESRQTCASSLNEYILADVITGGRCQCMQTLCIRRLLQKVLQQICKNFCSKPVNTQRSVATLQAGRFSEVAKKCSCYILTYCCLQSNRKKEKDQQKRRSSVATHHCWRSEGEVSRS